MSSSDGPAPSPHLKLDLAVPIDQLKIFPVGSDEACAVRAGSKGDENVEMQITQFMRFEAVIGTDFGQYFARLQPIVLCRGKDRVVSRQSREKLVVRRCLSATP